MSEPVRVEDQITPRTEGEKKAEPNAVPPALEFPTEQQIVDPFDGKTTRIAQVRRPIQVTQLAAELAEATELPAEDIHLSLAAPDPFADCSNSNQGTLYVSPAIDEAVVRQVISEHKADPEYGTHPSVAALREVKAKLAKGTELKPEEVQAALHALVMRDTQQV
jgi:hypothetical protein